MYPKRATDFVMNEEIMRMDTEMIKKYLFQITMRSRWEEVVRIYRLNKKAHGAKITKSGDTALHVAVSDGQEKHVKELVNLINVKELEIQNEQGNTPLHIAAWMGNVTMCLCLANARPSLVTTFNVDNETPLFLAAVCGKKDAFLCMHHIYTPILDDPRKRYNYCRRNNGDTILHYAISGDFFDLAFQIIHLYEDLVNYVNSEGFSPLHLLATKPSAFKSGSHLSRFQEIIYHCRYVDELKLEQRNEGIIKTFKEEENPKHPENYQTCINFIRLFWRTIRLVTKKEDNQREETQSADTGNVPQVPNRPHMINTIDQRGEIKSADPENPIEPNKQTLNTSNPGSKSNVEQGQGHKKFPGNYSTCFEFVKLISRALLIVFGLGSTEIRKTREKKEKHKWSVQIMNELLGRAVMYEDIRMIPQVTAPPSQKEKDNDETTPYNIADGGAVLMPSYSALDVPMPQQEAEQPKNGKEKTPEGSSADKKTENITPSVNTETPILIAAKNGVAEMVEKILELLPVAIHDRNKEKKNIVLLAVEYRQPHVYKLLLKRNILKERVFGTVDHEGNSALHLAAKLGEQKPWLPGGAALQMQWEIKWYEFVKNSMPLHFFPLYNKKNQTARDIFSESHAKLVKDGGEWLTKSSQNCSVMGGLVATVAFATATAVPGGIREATGTPILENQVAFEVFAISSLLAMCSSVMSMAIFLSILMSRFPERAFGKELPIKFFVGLTTFFLSILSMVVSFCAGHFFMLKDKLKHFAVPVYLMACMPLAFFAIIQLPLYWNLIYMHFKKVPYFYRKAEATE